MMNFHRNDGTFDYTNLTDAEIKERVDLMADNFIKFNQGRPEEQKVVKAFAELFTHFLINIKEIANK